MQSSCFISMVAVGMDATGVHGCKVKNLRNARFVLWFQQSWDVIVSRLNGSLSTRYHYRIVKSVFGLATIGQLAMTIIF